MSDGRTKTTGRGVVCGVTLLLCLSACAADRDQTLTRFKQTGNGPDEFSIAPGRPLQTPPDTTLPPPTPGQGNRADQQPVAQAVSALGGNVAANSAGGIPAQDGALVTYAGRRGVQPGVRQVLATEDADVRKRYGRVNILNLGYSDDYAEAYKRQWLDAPAEEDRLRRAGVRTPTAPPK